MSLTFEISALYCVVFILTFILGVPRIQVFCTINQGLVSKVFIRKPGIQPPFFSITPLAPRDSSLSSGRQIAISEMDKNESQLRARVVI